MLAKREMITSKELLVQVNLFREQEYKAKRANGTLTEAEKKRGKFVELEHKDLLKVIRDEFEEEIDEGKISPMSYKDTYSREQTMFILTYNQAKQVLLRESKFVRRAIIHYIELLEQAIIDKNKSEWLLTRQQGKLVRREETDAIQNLIEYAKQQGSQHADNMYMSYSKLVNSLVGIKANSRDKADFEILSRIRILEDMFTKIILNSIDDDIFYKEIYQKCKKQGTEFIGFVSGGYLN
nr:MAG TPA: hypothetical protein [Caudoviricetes sp.]